MNKFNNITRLIASTVEEQLTADWFDGLKLANESKRIEFYDYNLFYGVLNYKSIGGKYDKLTGKVEHHITFFSKKPVKFYWELGQDSLLVMSKIARQFSGYTFLINQPSTRSIARFHFHLIKIK